MTSLYEVLKAQKMGEQIAPDYFTALWAGYTGGGSWEVIEYTGAVPVTIYADGSPLIDWTVKGNMEQKSDNLWDKGDVSIALGARTATVAITVPTNTYTLSFHVETEYTGAIAIYVYNSNGTYVTKSYTPSSGRNSITVSNTDITSIKFYSAGGSYAASYTAVYSEIMLNAGSTALPYVPYTPSPSAPVTPQECGERTENLLDTTGAVNGYLKDDGSFTSPHSTLYTTDYLKIPTGATAITQSYQGEAMVTPALCFYDSSKNFISGTKFNGTTSKSFTIPNNAVYFRTCYRTTFEWCMLNSGSTALPFAPYGYYLPISSGGVTTPVYLGEVETERKIKKLVLTGSENWERNDTYSTLRLSISDGLGTEALTCMCTHYIATNGASSAGALSDKEICIRSTGATIWIKDTSYTSADDFKAYLAQQYANGTPVTIWYVLSTPTTGILNEPLRKIGSYADSLSVSQTIPTVEGSNVVDVETTIKPSEVYIKYKGRSNS